MSSHSRSSGCCCPVPALALLVPVIAGLLCSLLASGSLAADDAVDEVGTQRVLLLGQDPDNHPAGTHEYLPGMKILAHCLRSVPGVEIDVVHVKGAWTEGPDLIRQADCVVVFVAEGAKWMHADPRRLEAFAQLAARGGGLVTLHWGMGTRDPQYITGFLRLFGGCHGGPDRKYQVVEAAVQPVDAEHDIVRGVRPFTIRDEFYYKLKLIAPDRVQPILQTTIDGQVETVAWAWQRADGGRAFGFSGGHFHSNWSRVEYRRLMAQAVLWTLRLPVPQAGLAVKITAADLALPPRP